MDAQTKVEDEPLGRSREYFLFSHGGAVGLVTRAVSDYVILLDSTLVVSMVTILVIFTM